MYFPEGLENTPFTFEKNLNFCSENWLHLFSSLWVNLPLIGIGLNYLPKQCKEQVFKNNLLTVKTSLKSQTRHTQRF